MTKSRLLPATFLALSLTACADDSADPGADETAGTASGDTGMTSTDTGAPPSCEPLTPGFRAAIGGVEVPVVNVCKFAVPVNYVRYTHPGAGTPVTVEITAPDAVGTFVLSPRSKGIEATASGNVLSFTADEPGYFILQIPNQQRMFVLLDPPETDAPVLGDPAVLNVMDIPGMDNTGATDMTAPIQAAIDAASGASQNILYFPPGLYATKALYLKSDMTLYLADGAVLQNITTAAAALSQVPGVVEIEGSTRGYIVLNGVKNTKILGRGTIDGNGVTLQEGNRKSFLLKIENSSDCVIDGIIARDSAFWNTMIFRSDNITIRNYKVINNRLDGEWNETDGVDYNNSTNSTLTNAFLYTGDDCMAVKSDDMLDDRRFSGLRDPAEGPYINVANLVHEKIVCFSGSSGCKVGTKTFGESISDVVFRDVDLVSVNRALVIDGVDTATVTGTVFDDIRVEEVTGRLIDFNMDAGEIFWRTTPGIATILDTYVTDVTSEDNAECRIWGNHHDWSETDPYFGESYYVDGVTFSNFVVQGNVITSADDPNASFNINDYVMNISFEES